MDYCTGPSFASGGFIADSQFDGSTVINGSQQQWLYEEQQPRRLDERRLEPGVLGRRRCTGPVLPRSAVVVRWPVHHPRDQPGDTGGAVPVRGLSRALQRLRARGTAQLGGRVMGRRADRRLVDPDRQVLHRRADRLRQDDQQRARPRREPDHHSRRLSARQDDRRQAPRHGGARSRIPDARPDRR